MEPEEYNIRFARYVPLFCGYEIKESDKKTDEDGFGIVSYKNSDPLSEGVPQLNMITEFPKVSRFIISDWSDQMGISITKFLNFYRIIESKLTKQ